MDTPSSLNLIMIPAAELESIKAMQNEILSHVRNINEQVPVTTTVDEFILAAEYMKAVKIKRTKFYSLISNGKIRTIKKCRKIYVHASEVSRFFLDPSIN